MRTLLLAVLLGLLVVGCDNGTPSGPTTQKVKYVTKLGIPLDPAPQLMGLVFDANDTLLIATNTGVYSYDWAAERWNKQASSPVAAGNSAKRAGLTKDSAGNIYFFVNEFLNNSGVPVQTHYMRRKVGSSVFEPLPSIAESLPYMAADKLGNLYAGWSGAPWDVYLYFLAAGASSWSKRKIAFPRDTNIGGVQLIPDSSGSNIYVFAEPYGLFRMAAGTTNLESIFDFNTEGIQTGQVLADINGQMLSHNGTTLYRIDPTLKTYTKVVDRPIAGGASMRNILRDKAGNIYAKVYLGPAVDPTTYDLYKLPVGSSTWQTSIVARTAGADANFILDESANPYIVFSSALSNSWDIAKILK